MFSKVAQCSELTQISCPDVSRTVQNLHTWNQHTSAGDVCYSEPPLFASISPANGILNIFNDARFCLEQLHMEFCIQHHDLHLTHTHSLTHHLSPKYLMCSFCDPYLYLCGFLQSETLPHTHLKIKATIFLVYTISTAKSHGSEP